ncbi:HsdR family type I site-specific deoxyribonuclease [Marinobacter nanhaiticus D15-8W]|uniref:type I site-specific deoxyribonuclease n=1 Tax=Marinobacter nanhaiticus D15-8W TaxID=626887 RepID=N6WYB5_9GAMM|nr:type I restriction endonuclease subunit R [Marinobacter nanhaiticus]ENO16107.1 type I restriction endonuclease subunit R [Marinobacter nanhaiticus D15-8W]BES73036.1 HsdR family type I site-specific deoxyribonuclease [Marinobacter nanhaiticus D15-8W]
MPGPEFTEVELPFIQQLEQEGWDYIEGSLDSPSVTHRETFAQVIMEPLLRDRLLAINTRNGKPWLDERRLDQAVSAITRLPASKVMEANKLTTGLLHGGITVEGLSGWDGGRGQTIHFIDWTNPENNTFTVVNQFKVKCPPGHDGWKGHVIPDLVLFVNGIPLVVIECKSRTVPEGLSDAVDQLRRYYDQRHLDLEVEQHEGAPALFSTNQFMVASNFDDARVGTIGAGFNHYLNWKTVAPRSEADVTDALGVQSLSSQQRLIAGMLPPANLLDIVRHFTLFMTMGGQTIKLVCRYQQYRAVTRAVQRLKTGKTRAEDGEHDRRGGIIGHTQGSGKSLTMVFLVLKLRTDPELRRFKVVVITDRKDLQDQLSDTAELTGETVKVASNTGKLKLLLGQPGPGLIFGTIQKYREHESASPAYPSPKPPRGLETDRRDAADNPERKPAKPIPSRPLGLINESPDILVMIDEAHRTQAGDLHANLLQAVPNAARIGFTGTPIIMGKKKQTSEIFGDYIDRYTIKEAENDGATVPILYEGRTAEGAVKEGANLDDLFEDLFKERTKDELELIKKKYATKGQIFEAPRLIEEKAADILRHYVTNILPNGFKAQLVAYSRRAAIRYLEALKQSRTKLLEEAMALPPEDKNIGETELISRPPRIKAAIKAWQYRELLQQLEFAVVFSSSNNDDSGWAQWSDRSAIEQNIKRFKKPLFHKDPEKADPLSFLIVKSMLLTGFDAPIAGVMYLDRPIREAELLQAVARVNRTGFGKRCGIVVDYYGVANHLKEALAAYSDEDIEGALQSLKDEIPLLRDRHLRVVDVLRKQGIDSLTDTEEAVTALGDERLRAEFIVKLKEFSRTLDDVLPRPEALEFVNDAKQLAHIHALARNRYKDSPELGKDVGSKVRKLIDDYMISLGINPKIPPVQLTDTDFDQHINRQVSDRAKASEMEHAVRSHVRKHLDEDPVKYTKLSERLKDILEQMDGLWQEQVDALSALIRQLQEDETTDDETPSALPPNHLPFLRVMAEIKQDSDEALTSDEQENLEQATVSTVQIITEELRIPDFWKPSHLPDQERLRGRLFEELFELDLFPVNQLDALLDKLIDLAKANHSKLVNP